MNKTALITGANKGILIHGQSPLSLNYVNFQTLLLEEAST